MEKEIKDNEELWQTSLFGEPASAPPGANRGSSRAAARESSSSWGMVQQRKESQPMN